MRQKMLRVHPGIRDVKLVDQSSGGGRRRRQLKHTPGTVGARI